MPSSQIRASWEVNGTENSDTISASAGATLLDIASLLKHENGNDPITAVLILRCFVCFSGVRGHTTLSVAAFVRMTLLSFVKEATVA
jgi:hypothetical protein